MPDAIKEIDFDLQAILHSLNHGSIGERNCNSGPPPAPMPAQGDTAQVRAAVAGSSSD